MSTVDMINTVRVAVVVDAPRFSILIAKKMFNFFFLFQVSYRCDAIIREKSEKAQGLCLGRRGKSRQNLKYVWGEAEKYFDKYLLVLFVELIYFIAYTVCTVMLIFILLLCHFIKFNQSFIFLVLRSSNEI